MYGVCVLWRKYLPDYLNRFYKISTRDFKEHRRNDWTGKSITINFSVF